MVNAVQRRPQDVRKGFEQYREQEEKQSPGMPYARRFDYVMSPTKFCEAHPRRAPRLLTFYLSIVDRQNISLIWMRHDAPASHIDQSRSRIQPF
jgi:hypothetical protein